MVQVVMENMARLKALMAKTTVVAVVVPKMQMQVAERPVMCALPPRPAP
jgi:hypothetical protein